MKMLNALGVILFFLGLGLLAHAQILMETSIESSSLGLDDYSSAPSRIMNIDLVAQKLNNTIIGGILIISGLVMSCAVDINSLKKKI